MKPEYLKAQIIAKETMEYAKNNIHAGMKLVDIRLMCEKKMIELGADSFWYWNIGAFVFAGEDTIISISGAEYSTKDRDVGINDIITIDLSPQIDGAWGDYARTFVIEEGIIVKEESIKNKCWLDGIRTEKFLHNEMCKFVKPNTTFEELYIYLNQVITELGYCNLDFMGNLGHSIEGKMEERVYIERGNTKCLKSVNYFTFEPHICKKNTKYGFKREDIYYFEEGIIKKL